MQRSSTQEVSTSLLSLPLMKFSCAIDAAAEAEKFTWRHTTQDLVVVFDSFRGDPNLSSGLPSKMMKVVQGTQILESFDIEEKIRSATNAIDAMRRHGVEIRNEQLPMAALVRCPFLAIRYTLPNSMIRRLQLKFTSEHDFKLAVDLLERMGCRISHSVPPPDTAAAVNHLNSGPSCPPGSSASITSRPAASAWSGRQNIDIMSAQASSQHRVEPASSTENLRPQTMQTVTSLQTSFPISYPQPASLTETYRHPHPVLVPAQLHRSATLPSQSSSDSHEFMRPPSAVSATSEQNHIPQSVQGLHQHHVDISKPQKMHPRLSYSSPGPVERGPSSIASAVRSHFPHLQTIVENDSPLDQRPSTAPVYLPETSLAHLIPPRRELPFGRTSAAQTTNGAAESGSSSRPSSSTVDLPPLPRPKFVDNAVIGPSAGSKNSRDNGNLFDRRSSLPFSTLSNTSQNSRQMTPLPPNRPGSSAQQPLALVSDPKSSAIPKSDNPSSTSTSSETAYLDRIIARISAEATSGDDENLASFATQPVDGRRTVINDWMIQHIEDDGFLTLCQDVWGCWRRIGLGL